MSTAKLYIELHALLDTRMGCLSSIDPDYALAVCKSPKYFLREVDEFSHVEHGALDPELYKQCLQSLQNDVLLNSPMTCMVGWIHRWLQYFSIREVNSPIKGLVDITVNTYPYTFSEEEQSDLIEALRLQWGPSFGMSLICTNPATMSLEDDDYTTYIHYSSEWLVANQHHIAKNQYLGVNVYQPRLNAIRALTADEKLSLKKEGIDPFDDLITEVLKTKIKIDFLPVSLFCIDAPENPSHQEPQTA